MWPDSDRIGRRFDNVADVTKRMLDLLAVLQTGRKFSGADLARRLETSPRTLRRDVDRLREYGYPVTTQPGPSGFYELGAGARVPPLMFDDEEAVATLIGLAMASAAGRTDDSADTFGGDDRRLDGISAAADRAYGKVDQLLPAPLRAKAQLVRASMEVAPGRAPVIDAAVFGRIGEACSRHELITFDYHPRDRATVSRRVEPFRQILMRQRWYLVAWDLDKADWRTFRIDRISDLVVTGHRFTPRPLPADDGREFLHAAITQGRHRTVVTIEAPADVVADRLKFADCAIEPMGDRQCRVTAFVDSFEWFVVNIGILGADFQIHDPAEFATLSQQMGRRLAKAGAKAGRRPG